MQKNMRALALIPLLALVACSVQPQAVTVLPGTRVVVQDEPFFRGGLLSLANGQIAERNTQRRSYTRAHQSPDCPAETAAPSAARQAPSPHDDGGVAAAIEQGNAQNWLAQQQSNFWQMQNWQAQQQGNFWDMVGAMR